MKNSQKKIIKQNSIKLYNNYLYTCKYGAILLLDRVQVMLYM